jgi:hypothetical protein
MWVFGSQWFMPGCVPTNNPTEFGVKFRINSPQTPGIRAFTFPKKSEMVPSCHSFFPQEREKREKQPKNK